MDKAKVFIMWLDGFLDGRETLDEKQTLTIKNKLDGIFDHEAMDAITADKPTSKSFPSFEQSRIPDGPNGEKYRC
jgi:hypothetical protein